METLTYGLRRESGSIPADLVDYSPLVTRLDGQVVKISPTSTQYVNPMDINLNYSDDDNPLALKVDFLLSFCDIVVGSKDGLQPVEKTVIDRCVRNVYRPYLADPDPARMPMLQDLYDELLAQPETEAQRIAAALELYVSGSLNVFNHRTNVELANRLVCFNIKELGKQLKQLGMLVIQDQVWNRVTVNRAAGKTTRYYCDEFHLLLKGELASWSVEIWKRFASGAASRRESRRTSRICLPPGRSRIYWKILTSSICSTRPRGTGRFWPSSSTSAPTSSPM